MWRPLSLAKPANPQKWTWQLFAALSASIGLLMTGFVRGYSSPAVPSIIRDKAHETNDDVIALIASVPATGSMVAALLSVFFLKYLGRRRTLLLTSVPWSVSFLMVGFSRGSQWLLYGGRFIMGTMVGLSIPAAQIYIAECTSPRIRGTLASLPALFLSAGILLTYVIGSFAEWNVLAWICSAFPVLLLASMLLMPESPTWLLSNGQAQQARQSLRKLRGPLTDISAEWERITDNMADAMATSHQARAESRTDGGQWLDPSFVKPLIISLGLMFGQQFCGINVVIYYTVIIFEAAGTSLDANVSTIIVGTVQFVSTLVATLLVDRSGRRPLLLASGSLMTISMTSLGTYFYLNTFHRDLVLHLELGWLPLASLGLDIFAYSLGYSNVPYVVMGELFPVRHRNISGALASLTSLTGLFVTLFTFPRLSCLLGHHGAFWAYAACSALAVLFVHRFLPETKGRTLEEIERSFHRPTPSDYKPAPNDDGPTV